MGFLTKKLVYLAEYVGSVPDVIIHVDNTLVVDNQVILIPQEKKTKELCRFRTAGTKRFEIYRDEIPADELVVRKEYQIEVKRFLGLIETSQRFLR